MEAELRELVWRRASRRCEYCQFPADISQLPFQIDHIIPQKLRGPTVADNLALSCERRDSHKGPMAAGYHERIRGWKGVRGPVSEGSVR